jgi:6-phosphofructo-2-kinase/fructose-2,6-biphosphatase 4
MGPGMEIPEDYFFINASAASVMLRQKILKKCREDIYGWLNHENGQVAIYDAVNPLSGGRRSLAKEFAKHDVQASRMLSRDAAPFESNLLINYRPYSSNRM